MGVLSGVRIVEIAGIGPGPFCGMLLADLGADVIVIERKSDDAAVSRPNVITHRGKRSLEIDLKSADGVALVLRLLRGADALIEGMRPGVMERLGLGPAVCLEANPALVYGRMTGWGQQGPMSHAAGHDSNYLALCGALWWAGGGDTAPELPSTVVGDIGGGSLYLAVGLLAGILNARSTGRGQVVDAAIVDGAAHLTNLILMMRLRHKDTERYRVGSPSPHWATTYCCADGGYVTLASLEPKFYHEMLVRLELSTDPTFVNGQHDTDAWPVLRAHGRDVCKPYS